MALNPQKQHDRGKTYLLYEITVDKAAALCSGVLVLEGAPVRVVKAAHALDHLAQAVLQAAEELELRLRQAGDDADRAAERAEQQGGDLGRLAVRQLHDQRAVLETVHKVSKVELPHRLQKARTGMPAQCAGMRMHLHTTVMHVPCTCTRPSFRQAHTSRRLRSSSAAASLFLRSMNRLKLFSAPR